MKEETNGTAEAIPAPAAEVLVERRPYPVAKSQVVEMPETPGLHYPDLKTIYEEEGLDFETGLPKVEEDDNEVDEETPVDSVETHVENEEENSGEKTPQQWAELIRETPGRINEIPAKMRGETIQLVLDARVAAERANYTQSHQQSLQEARQQWEAETASRQAVAEIDELLETDGEGFAEWAKQYPDRVATYYDIKRREKNGSLPDPSVTAAQERQSSAAVIISRLDQYPDLKAKLYEKAKNEPARYDATKVESLANVAEDVAELLIEAETEKRTKADAPSREAAEARQKAATDLKGVPKPNLKSGSPAKGALTLETLKAMSVEENMALMATPEGQAEINRVLATA